MVTTLEQSKMLLEAGMYIGTADFYYNTGCESELRMRSDDDGFTPDVDIPAWSMGRLWKLLNKSGICFYEFSTGESVEEVMNGLVSAAIRIVKSRR